MKEQTETKAMALFGILFIIAAVPFVFIPSEPVSQEYWPATDDVTASYTNMPTLEEFAGQKGLQLLIEK